MIYVVYAVVGILLYLLIGNLLAPFMVTYCTKSFDEDDIDTVVLLWPLAMIFTVLELLRVDTWVNPFTWLAYKIYRRING